MAATDVPENQAQRTGNRTLEFDLVVYMLITLTALVLIILIVPIEISAGTGTDSLTQILKYRQDLLTVIVTAFSAWIGAGAAYFFGRENMREATKSMLEMRQLPPREKLRQISLKELPPRPITWKVTTSDPVLTIYEKLKKDISWWFIVITRDDETLETVIEEEAVWRYIDSLAAQGKKPEEVLKEKDQDTYVITVAKLLDFIETDTKLKKKVRDIYLKATNDNTLGAVNDQMMEKGLFLAIITNESDKPVSYVSSDDIRKAFLTMT
jgi:hypothetical protein